METSPGRTPQQKESLVKVIQERKQFSKKLKASSTQPKHKTKEDYEIVFERFLIYFVIATIISILALFISS